MIDTTTPTTSTLKSNSIWYDQNGLDQFVIVGILAIIIVIFWAWTMIKFNNKKNKY
jgi:hypothetical protein